MKTFALAGAQALLLDCDGVVVDSEPAWRDAEATVHKRHGLPYTIEDARRYRGVAVDAVAAAICLAQGLRPTAFAEVAAELVDAWQVRRSAVQVMPGVAEALRSLKQDARLAVVSNTPEYALVELMGVLDLDGNFEVIVGLRCQERPKPAPDLYLRACRMMELHPSECMAFEDSDVGAEAAVAAGIPTVGIGLSGGMLVETAPSLGDWSRRRRRI